MLHVQTVIGGNGRIGQFVVSIRCQHGVDDGAAVEQMFVISERRDRRELVGGNEV